MSDKPAHHIIEDNEGLAFECARLDREIAAARGEADKWHSRVATLEMIGSSLLHGHKMSEVDWKAFKALEEYFRIHGPESDELEK